MAVKQRGTSWQADITIPGHKRMRETFLSKPEAEAWIAQVRAAAASGKPLPRPELSDTGNPKSDSEKRGGARFSSFAAKTHAKYWQGSPRRT